MTDADAASTATDIGATGIYRRAIAAHIEAVASRRREIAASSPEIGIDIQEIAANCREMTTYKREIGIHIREIAIDSQEMTANS